MAIMLDGKKTAQSIHLELKNRIQNDIVAANKPKPKLAIVRVGNDEASKIYVEKKYKLCVELGIECDLYLLDENASQDELHCQIATLNVDKSVTGILLQLPLPKHLNASLALEQIDPQKDVDGLTSAQRGMLWQDSKRCLVPCTPKGIITLLDKYGIDLKGKHVCILGRSLLVGKPLAALCLERDATVTMCHSKTQNLASITQTADVLVAAIGNAKFVKKDMVKQNAIVIDVGISRALDGKICGDVDFIDVEPIASYITPVPNGVGPMTVAMLMENIVSQAINAEQEKA